MRKSGKRRLMGALVACFALMCLGSSPDAGIPSLSGISQASRGLSDWLVRGLRFDSKSVGQLLSVLNDLKITDQATDATIKRSLRAVSGNAKTASEHLSQLELLMDQTERALEKANADLRNATGPSLDELANEQTRCKSIERLRAANRSFGEAVETVQNLPAVLAAVEQRAGTLHNFLNNWTRALEDMLANPVLSGILYEQLGEVWVDAEFDRDRASTMQNRVARVQREVSSLPNALEQRRRNFDANMAALIEPLARDSCSVALDISGEWQGRYYYGDGRPPVHFTMQLRKSFDGLSGYCREPNTFDRRGGQLGARINGNLSGKSITFTKTYDGSGGYNHSVSYSGRISGSGNAITGHWRLGALSGRFEMSR